MKIALVFFVVLLLTSISTASETVVSMSIPQDTTVSPIIYQNIKIKTVCIDGYVYAVAASRDGIGIVQMFHVRNGFPPASPPQPIVCK